MTSYPKRLIEVDLPIKRISAHARREKSIRHGHISTLHIWWARRPLAACRAVICAALWPDPADELCPQEFRDRAAKAIFSFANEVTTGRLGREHCSDENWAKWNALVKNEASFNTKSPSHLNILRFALLDFIADFANWDNSTVKEYLETSRTLTQAAHEALGGEKGTRPLVVDPFAGGGSIPLEALRVGADAFASDLNPVAVLLNKVVLEYIPKYGKQLPDELRKWGEWVKKEAEKELCKYYPKDQEGATPIAYLWARTIKCEGPGCGVEIPLMRQPIIGKNSAGEISIEFDTKKKGHKLSWQLSNKRNIEGTCRGFKATCPIDECSYTTPKKNVQQQLMNKMGGTNDAMLMAILTVNKSGRKFRVPSARDISAIENASTALKKIVENKTMIAIIPNEPIPTKDAHRAVGSQLPLYGFKTWGDLFTNRQKLAIYTFQKKVNEAFKLISKKESKELAEAIHVLLAFAVDKLADYSSSLCRWVPGGEFIAATLGGEKKLPMLSDFAECNPIGDASGNWLNQIDWMLRFLERELQCCSNSSGTIINASADIQNLPSESVAALITDPPYYDSVPYSDLSDFFFVWLKRTLFIQLSKNNQELSPKEKEMTVNHPGNIEETIRYEILLTSAFSKRREEIIPNGIGVIVFAHKSTSGWESLLEAIIKSGWIITGSWPIDTERGVRMNAIGTASLASSIHLVCRPRENFNNSDSASTIGDWRDVLQELPKRIHDWMPRLAHEGVVGADAIFACLGPALEIFSRYSSVEKASGEQVTLKEYLEHVWAVVAKEALDMVFAGAQTSDFEEDARLTAMWLWTLSTDKAESESEDKDEDSDKSESGGRQAKIAGGFVLEYDAARKIAQGLGAHLEQLGSLIEAKGETARLLPVSERAKYLFGKDAIETPQKKKKKSDQTNLFAELGLEDAGNHDGFDIHAFGKIGKTVLDRLHQSMILFATGRSEALKRFLVEDGVGQDQRFWRLAQAFSALYPAACEEKRWVDGVMARKKGLGY